MVLVRGEEIGVLGHISFGVSDLARTSTFYDAAMQALGYGRVVSRPDCVGYGVPGTGNDRLLLILKPEPIAPPGPGFHLAFAAPSRDAVDRFHAAALQFGGTNEGAPGPRPRYGPAYCAAFVRDPDGYKLEAKYPPPEP
jgi:catechol 2,3-dioxygenase-like lactoylglutathione lyase family enzyme